jgi:hypothetical protein
MGSDEGDTSREALERTFREALERTARETRSLTGFDLGRLAVRANRAYWQIIAVGGTPQEAEAEALKLLGAQ